MRLKDYGNWVSMSAILNPGKWKKEYGSPSLELLLEKNKHILLNNDLYYAIIEFRKHGQLKYSFKISPAQVRHTIYVEVYDPDPDLPIDRLVETCNRACKKDQLIEKLIRLGKEFQNK